MNYGFFAIMAIIIFAIFSYNLMRMFFSLDVYKNHQKRLKQLDFNKNDEVSTNELINIISKPVAKYLLPYLSLRDLEQLEKDIRILKWDNYFTATSFRAFDITLKIIGTLLLFILFPISKFLAVVWFLVLFFLLNALMKNNIKERKEALMLGFPDFIRITEGYLSAGLTFLESIEKTIPYVDKVWQPILQNFLIEANLSNITSALDYLKKEVDSFEVREFVSIVKLTLEQGGDAKDGFSSQADRMRELQMNMIEIKIGKRKIYGIMLQGPLLIGCLLVFGLPVAGSMTTGGITTT